jgi:hypothetical protein
MTLAIILNAVFVIALLTLLAATMRLPFMFRSREEGRARLRRHRARAPARSRTAVGARSVLTSD